MKWPCRYHTYYLSLVRLSRPVTLWKHCECYAALPTVMSSASEGVRSTLTQLSYRLVCDRSSEGHGAFLRCIHVDIAHHLRSASSVTPEIAAPTMNESGRYSNSTT